MGKSRALKTKRIVGLLMDKHADRFSTDFEENKKVIGEVTTIVSKPLRNRIAGYITKLAVSKEGTKTESSNPDETT
jgi:small subunit ribosomal protein S17e